MGSEETVETNTKVLKLGVPPSWVKAEYVLETEIFWLHNTSYEYAVLDIAKIREDQESKSESEGKIVLPDVFVLRTDNYLAVSDTYPKAYRPVAIVHEVREFSEKEQRENSCVEAVGYELEQLKFFGIYAKDTPAYLAFRFEFFDQFIKFFERQEGPKDEAFLNRLRHSREYLQRCIEADPARAITVA